MPAAILFYISIYMNTSAAKSHKGFTLVEIMIVVAIIALLAAIAVPGFLRARKRSQASRILNDLRMIDSAVDQYAIETNRKTGDVVKVADWTNYSRWRRSGQRNRSGTSSAKVCAFLKSNWPTPKLSVCAIRSEFVCCGSTRSRFRRIQCCGLRRLQLIF